MMRTDVAVVSMSLFVLSVGIWPAAGIAQSDGEAGQADEAAATQDAAGDQSGKTDADPASQNGEDSSPTISADRPGFSSSTDTVPAGRFQLEAGVAYTRTILSTPTFDNRSDTATINVFGVDALGRYSLGDALELRLGVSPISVASASNQDTADATGLGSVSVGAKYTLTRGETVSFGVLPAVELGSALDSASLNAGLTGILDLHVLDPVSTTINATVGGSSLVAEREGSSPALTYSAAASFGYGLSDKWGTYAEYYLLGVEGVDPTHHIDAGLTYLLNNQLQLDLYGDYQVTGDNSFQLGAGVSYLF